MAIWPRVVTKTSGFTVGFYGTKGPRAMYFTHHDNSWFKLIYIYISYYFWDDEWGLSLKYHSEGCAARNIFAHVINPKDTKWLSNKRHAVYSYGEHVYISHTLVLYNPSRVMCIESIQNLFVPIANLHIWCNYLWYWIIWNRSDCLVDVPPWRLCSVSIIFCCCDAFVRNKNHWMRSNGFALIRCVLFTGHADWNGSWEILQLEFEMTCINYMDSFSEKHYMDSFSEKHKLLMAG